MDLCRDTLPATPYFSDVSVISNMPGAMPTLVVGMWEVQADRNHGHASVAMAPVSKPVSRRIWSGNVANSRTCTGVINGSFATTLWRLLQIYEYLERMGSILPYCDSKCHRPVAAKFNE
jgi:hypothetical protein